MYGDGTLGGTKKQRQEWCARGGCNVEEVILYKKSIIKTHESARHCIVCLVTPINAQRAEISPNGLSGSLANSLDTQRPAIHTRG